MAIVVYFHHVSPVVDHYASLTPDSFQYGIELLVGSFAPACSDEIARPDDTFSRRMPRLSFSPSRTGTRVSWTTRWPHIDVSRTIGCLQSTHPDIDALTRRIAELMRSTTGEMAP